MPPPSGWRCAEAQRAELTRKRMKKPEPKPKPVCCLLCVW